MNFDCSNCSKYNRRTIDEKKDIIKRLNIIEGQIKGIKDMVNSDRYCNDLLIQISASMNSLKALGNNILKTHMKTCMLDEINNGNLESIDDVIKIMDKINR